MRALAVTLAMAACSSRATPRPEAAGGDARVAAPAAPAAPAPASGGPAPAPAAPAVRAIGVGEHLSCALLTSGDVRCWGATRLAIAPSTPRPVSLDLTDATALAVGVRHVCVVRAGGTVWCWGDNRDGQLGVGVAAGTQLDVPTRVEGLAGIVELVAGGAQTCARDAAGAVWCWGHPGEVGHGRDQPSDRPGRVVELPPATRLAAGDDVTCAFLVEGAPRCWGFNTALLFGDQPGPMLRATASAVLAHARVLGLGHRTACFAADDGVAWCGGDDNFGELGAQRVPADADCHGDQRTVTCRWTDPPPPPPWPVPGQHPPPDRWPPPPRAAPAAHTATFPARSWFVHPGATGRTVYLAGGHGRTCAISDTAEVWCWGQWYHASLEWSFRRPHVIAGTQGAIAVAVAEEHACALLADASVRCWGYDRAGELGDGAAARHIDPTPEAQPVRW